MKQKIFAKWLQKTKISAMGAESKNQIAVFLVMAALIASLGIIQQTSGRFAGFFIVTDSALATKFDVITIAPKEFYTEESGSGFEYRFLSPTDIQRLTFRIVNRGETEIICKPYVNCDIAYRIYVEGEECTEFWVAASDIVEFWLLIAPDGLTTDSKEAELFIDVWQGG